MQDHTHHEMMPAELDMIAEGCPKCDPDLTPSYEVPDLVFVV
ncbi:MAG: hypothetical protein O3C40_21215 [Planctomycetota bacterium]|nr:hypothetical protein [Planctomycetota bacterium]